MEEENGRPEDDPVNRTQDGMTASLTLEVGNRAQRSKALSPIRHHSCQGRKTREPPTNNWEKRRGPTLGRSEIPLVRRRASEAEIRKTDKPGDERASRYSTSNTLKSSPHKGDLREKLHQKAIAKKRSPIVDSLWEEKKAKPATTDLQEKLTRRRKELDKEMEDLQWRIASAAFEDCNWEEDDFDEESPFSTEIQAEPLPVNFKEPNMLPNEEARVGRLTKDEHKMAIAAGVRLKSKLWNNMLKRELDGVEDFYERAKKYIQVKDGHKKSHQGKERAREHIFMGNEHQVPFKRDPNKFCKFHKDIRYTTEECTHLRMEFEDLIQRGGLGIGGDTHKGRDRYVREARQPPIVMNLEQRPPKNSKEESSKAFNAVLGRRSLYHLKAIVSTYHLAMKFPTPGGVATTRGEQKEARECYNTSLSMAKKPQDSMAMVVCDKEACQQRTGVDLNPRLREEEVHVEPNKETEEVGISEHLLKVLKIGKGLYEDLKRELKQYLVRMKRRALNSVRYAALKEEVDKLDMHCFIWEAFHSVCVSNPVPVPKPNGKWRVCVDFTNLNKACPKDSFPLLHIDQTVDTTTGNKVLCFIDAYSGYNQIPMNPADEKHTSIITDRGLYCYRVMPFGLKNVGAKYKRFVNKIFTNQFRRNMEVYMNDVLVKSKKARDLIKDLDETFTTLMKYQMKLNPAKCIFGNLSGKFLGFIVNERGIEANLEKIQALIDMELPKNRKEVQCLTGRVAALNRFILRSADKCFPFFNTLRGNKQLTWGEECEETFQKLKEHLGKPPLLAKPEKGEPLFLYLGVLKHATSVALTTINGQVLTKFIVEFTYQPDKLEHAEAVEKEAQDETRSDSQLVVCQVEGEYQVKGNRVVAYLAKVKNYLGQLQHYIMEQITRDDNVNADALAKLALTRDIDTLESIPVEYLEKPTIEEEQAYVVTSKDSWMVPYQNYIQSGELPTDNKEAMRVVYMATRYVVMDGVLYKRGFSTPLLRCVGEEEALRILSAIHEEECWNHARGYSMS
uniref:Reverse transcriptase domain-containing protein n=1 Tax=Cannabis sativa TaxID=3483 RepID=A0A803Q709_CANSA